MIRTLAAGAAIAMTLAILPATMPRAAEPTDPQVVARTDAMKTIGRNMRVLGDMAKGSAAFDAAAAQEAAAAVAAEAAAIPALFEDPAQDPASESRPVIWEQYDDFTAKAADLERAASGAASQITAAADLGPAMGAIGATCKACHSTYRE
ncbi:c-type cytochrome [Mangrovicoccus algicola]|uniref:Cytochrome c n=1 Tax=Mangrovicoccus algicola TaxID=2771008 RepID=A0A8J6YVS2_9RHOB|nr:cytochrome c [Mangrovicoccus algicola]MBE3638755.1 cytochrome c [Mangrovicoccus algicola]